MTCGAELKPLADFIVISDAPPPFLERHYLLRRECLHSEVVFSTENHHCKNFQ